MNFLETADWGYTATLNLSCLNITYAVGLSEFFSFLLGRFLIAFTEDCLELSPVTAGAFGPSTDKYAACSKAKSVNGLFS